MPRLSDNIKAFHAAMDYISTGEALMPRPEGPTKLQRIDDLNDVLTTVGLKIGEPYPSVRRDVWYNMPRADLEKLIAFFDIMKDKLYALDRT